VEVGWDAAPWSASTGAAGCNPNDSSDSIDALDSTDFSRVPLPDATGPLEAVID